MSISRLTSLALVAHAVLAARFKKKSSTIKHINGVPVVNFDLAHVGVQSLDSETEVKWVLMAKEGTSDDQIQALCTRTAACKLTGHPNAGGIPFLAVHSSEKNLEKVMDGMSDVLSFIEPDVEVSLDPLENSGDGTAGTASEKMWGLERIGADKKAGTGKGVHVYILDTGIRTTHKDFGGRAFPSIDVSSGSLVECAEDDISCAKDEFFHGTHCAGTAVGTTYGVATEATAYAQKVLDDYGRGDLSWSYEALDWIVTKGSTPYVASMSLGGKGQSVAFGAAVNRAVSAGVVVVVAGGNYNKDSCEYSPAYVPAAITVGSTTEYDRKSNFSNWGSCTNIWAPGSKIKAPWHEDDETTYVASGTSMACPHVSGAAALILEKDASLSPAEVLQSLLANSQPNKIGDLKPDDTNRFLYVGADRDSQGPYCPETTYGPTRGQDCKCAWPLKCYMNGRQWCNFSLTEKYGRRSQTSCSVGCTVCECKP